MSKRGDPEGEVARHSLFPSVVPIPARIQRPIYPNSSRNPGSPGMNYVLCGEWEVSLYIRGWLRTPILSSQPFHPVALCHSLHLVRKGALLKQYICVYLLETMSHIAQVSLQLYVGETGLNPPASASQAFNIF